MNRILSVVRRPSFLRTLIPLCGVLAGAPASADDVFQPNAALRQLGPVNFQETRHMMAVVPALDSVLQSGTYVVGQRQYDLDTTVITTTRIRPDGSVAWTREWPEYPEGKNFAAAVLTDGGGYVWVLGAYTPAEGTNLDIVLLKYNYLGEFNPTAQGCPPGGCYFPAIYASPYGDFEDFPVAMAFDGATGLWITGSTATIIGQFSQDYLIWGVNPTTGLPLPNAVATFDHAHRADVPVEIDGVPVALSGGGGGGSNIAIVVTGTSFDPVTKNDVQTVVYQYDATVGMEQMIPMTSFWRRYGGTATESATGLAVRGGSGPLDTVSWYVCAYTTASANGLRDYLVLGDYWNGVSRTQWDNQQPGTGNGHDEPRKILVAADTNGVERVVVTGFSWTGGARDYDSWTLSYHPGGPNAGAIRFWRSPYNGDDRATDMVASPWGGIGMGGGHIYILGRAWNGIDYDYRTVKLRSSSAFFDPVWDGGLAPNGYVNYDVGAGPDMPAAIRLNYGGSVDFDLPDLWVAGRSTGPLEAAPRYATVHYTQSE